MELNERELFDCLPSGKNLLEISKYLISNLDLHSEFDPNLSSGFVIEGNRVIGLILRGYELTNLPEVKRE